MDPFSLTVGSISLVALAAKTIRVTSNYLREVRHGREAAAELLRELEILHANLSRLDGFLRTKEASQPFESTSVLVCSTSACRTKLTQLHQRLSGIGESRLTRFKWPLHSEEHRETVRELRAFALWIQFALTIDGCALMSKTSSEVLDTLKHQLETFQQIESLHTQTESIAISMRQQAQDARDQRELEERESVLAWLSTVKHEQKHHDVRMPHVLGTGEWLLAAKPFMSWRDEPQTCDNALWCHGIQGSGKSILASLVIERLRDAFEHENVAIAYFYFDYREQEAQSAEIAIASLLKQLCLAKSKLPQPVLELYTKLKGQKRPQLHDLEQAILSVCRAFDRVYVVIDALDECDSNVHRKAMLDFLHDLRTKSPISVFVTSRPHIGDSEEFFENCAKIEIQAEDSDLRKFVSREIDHSDAVDEIDEDFRTCIIERIMRGAQKMFLLAVLQVHTILSETCVGDMEQALEAMPRGLDDALGETLQRIQAQPEKRKQLGMKTLMWIFFSKRPLKVGELSEALAINPKKCVLDQKFRQSQKMMVSCCLGLVTVDEKSSVIRLVHYSVQEYFRENHTRLWPVGQQSVAELTISYLFSDAFAHGSCPEESELIALIHRHPFTKYAARFWGKHVRNAKSQAADNLALRLLRSSKHRACAIQISHYVVGYRKEYWDAGEASSRNGLHIASTFGLEKIAKQLLESGECDVDAVTQIGSTALIQAASNGHRTIIRMLLEQHADPAKANWYGTALHCAAESGSVVGIAELLSAGINVDIRDAIGRTPLHCATGMGHADAMYMLLEHGAPVNALDNMRYTSLRYAVVWEHDPITVKALLANRADTEIRSDSGFTVLHHAADMNLEGILVILLDFGADVNAAHANGSTALHLAAERGHIKIGRILLQAGADVNAQTKDRVTPLYLAAERGAETIACELLDYGAEVDAADEEGLTPLHVAVKEKHRAIVYTLLDIGADVNAKSNDGGTAIDFATENEDDKMMEALLKYGAEKQDRTQKDSPSEDQKTPLRTFQRREKINNGRPTSWTCSSCSKELKSLTWINKWRCVCDKPGCNW